MELKAPGKSLKTYKLDRNVVSCEEAAEAKGIPLNKELKTLVLATENGLISISLPANYSVSYWKIMIEENLSQVSLATKNDLDSLSLLPGTVTPLIEPLWSMRQLLDKKLFNMNIMSTNNGTLNGYVEFNPKIILDAPNVHIGDFSNAILK